MSAEILTIALVVTFIAILLVANIAIFSLSLKLYTEILKAEDQRQRRRNMGDEGEES